MAFLISKEVFIVINSFEHVHQDKFEKCPICERMILLTKIELHHTLPKSKGGTLSKTIRMCGCCHDMLHYYVTISNMSQYNTVEKIQKIESMQKYLGWIRTKKGFSYTIKKILKSLREN